MDAVKSVNLLIRFLLEMCVLIALGYWGFRAPSGFGKIALGVGGPLLVATLWGIFAAPKSSLRLREPSLWIFTAVVFLSAALALFTSGHVRLSAVFSLLAVINGVLLYLWRH